MNSSCRAVYLSIKAERIAGLLSIICTAPACVVTVADFDIHVEDHQESSTRAVDWLSMWQSPSGLHFLLGSSHF